MVWSKFRSLFKFEFGLCFTAFWGLTLYIDLNRHDSICFPFSHLKVDLKCISKRLTVFQMALKWFQIQFEACNRQNNENSITMQLQIFQPKIRAIFIYHSRALLMQMKMHSFKDKNHIVCLCITKVIISWMKSRVEWKVASGDLKGELMYLVYQFTNIYHNHSFICLYAR